MDIQSKYGVILFGFFALINIAAYITFFIDKTLAQKNALRISEATLLGLAFLGGSCGALLAQQHFWHKMQKQPFKTYLYTISLFHVGLIIVFMPPLFLAGKDMF